MQRQPRWIRISWSAGHLTASIEDSPTTRALARARPLTSTARMWGREVYCDTGITVPRETNTREVVEPGTVVLWTDGNAVALPYGPTLISRGRGCRLASPCNVMGRLDSDARLLATVRVGDLVRVEITTGA